MYFFLFALVCAIRARAFVCIAPCRKLKRLNLGGNELTSVPQRALSIFDNLKKLEIQENKIRVIKEGDFEGKKRNHSIKFNLYSSFLFKCGSKSLRPF